MEPTLTSVTLDQDSPVPLWRQLYRLLHSQIESGELTARLPSVRTLTQQYGVSHVTAERALRQLADDGLVIAVVGKGYYVKT